jgi:hypothetical protein
MLACHPLPLRDPAELSYSTAHFYGGRSGDGALEVLGRTTGAPAPGEQAPYHPPARADGETHTIVGLAHDHDGDAGGLCDPVRDRGAVREATPDEGEMTA